MERPNAAMLNQAMTSGLSRHPTAATLPRQRVRSSTTKRASADARLVVIGATPKSLAELASLVMCR